MTSASAWRTSSATRCWRWLGPAGDSERFGMIVSGIGPDAHLSRLRERSSRRSRPGEGKGETRPGGGKGPDSPLPPALSRKRERELQRPPHLGDVVALDDVAGAHV